jgi:hypothetical protein
MTNEERIAEWLYRYNDKHNPIVGSEVIGSVGDYWNEMSLEFLTFLDSLGFMQNTNESVVFQDGKTYIRAKSILPAQEGK